jgi:hypothetical protein
MHGSTASKVVTTLSSLGIVLVAVLALAALAMIGYAVYCRVARGWLAPVRRTVARVMLKTQREHEVTRSGATLGDGVAGAVFDTLLNSETSQYYDEGVYSTYEYFITFAFDGGQREFAVKEDLYASVHEGDEGLLVYKGDLLKHFIPGALKAEEIAPPHPPA